MEVAGVAQGTSEAIKRRFSVVRRPGREVRPSSRQRRGRPRRSRRENPRRAMAEDRASRSSDRPNGSCWRFSAITRVLHSRAPRGGDNACRAKQGLRRLTRSAEGGGDVRRSPLWAPRSRSAGLAQLPRAVDERSPPCGWIAPTIDSSADPHRAPGVRSATVAFSQVCRLMR
jgi:hypothetical protein